MRLARFASLFLFAVLVSGSAVAQDIPEAPVPDTRVRTERPDLDAVILGAALEMRGQDVESPAIVFTPEARAALRADGFDYAGFGRPRYALGKLVKSETSPGEVEVGALLSFVDALLRRSAVSILLSCSWSGDGQRITVHRAVVGRAAPPVPKTMLVIVPAERVPKDLITTRSHAALLSWIFENRATDEELASGGADACYLFAIVFDRLPPGSRVTMCVSDDPSGVTGESGNAEDVDRYQGWHVALMRGRFDWRGDRRFYVKVLHTPGGGGEPGVVQILSSDLVVVDESGRPIDGALGALVAADTMRILLAALGIAGLAICLLGRRLGKLFWGVAGLAFGGILVYLAPIGFAKPWMGQGALVVAAILGGIAMARAPMFGRLAWGVAIGLVIGLFLTGLPCDPTDPMLFAPVGVAAVLAAVLPRTATIVISSLLGSSLVAVAAGHWIGCFDATAFQGALRGLGGDAPGSLGQWVLGLRSDMQVFFVLAFVLFAGGVAAQLAKGRGRASERPA